MPAISLHEFIRDSLSQIALGVRDANKATSEALAVQQTYFQISRQGGATRIGFDVAVSSKHGAEIDATGKAKVFVVDASIDATGSIEQARVSRISFAVEVNFALT